MVNFVAAEQMDAEVLRDIAVQAFADDLHRYGAMPPGIDSLEWHTAKVADGMYYKILAKEAIVGGFKLFDLGNGHFCLGAIFIAPDYQNQGIGSAALEFIEEKYNRVKRWTLDTPYLNTANHRFYERHGYKKIDTIQPERGKEFYLFVYEKILEQ